jgi:mannose-6-phosphate isomerase-like protein (cupin superfamily)
MVAASIDEKFWLITEHWPRALAELNGQEVKLVKFQGEFLWHHHDNADEMFPVWRGQMRVGYRDRVVSPRSGEYCVVPREAEHRTCADQEAAVVLFEPSAARNTGNVVDERFTAPDASPL